MDVGRASNDKSLMSDGGRVRCLLRQNVIEYFSSRTCDPTNIEQAPYHCDDYTVYTFILNFYLLHKLKQMRIVGCRLQIVQS